MKREFKYGPLISNLFLILGILFLISTAIIDFTLTISRFYFYILIIVFILFIIVGMYRKLTYYVYIGEYAISVNTNILKPNISIPWREISDIEVEENKRIIVVYRSGDKALNLFINKINIEKSQWNSLVDNIIEQWRDNPSSTEIPYS